MKKPLNYDRSAQKIEYFNIDYRANTCEMYQVINVKTLLKNLKNPETVKLKGMLI